MFDERIRSLAAAVMLQAVRDYVREDSPQKRGVIIRDLKSEWMLALSDGMSETVAAQLQSNKDEIAARLKVAETTM